jgi:hypothetical protein
MRNVLDHIFVKEKQTISVVASRPRARCQLCQRGVKNIERHVYRALTSAQLMPRPVIASHCTFTNADNGGTAGPNKIDFVKW